MEGGKDTDMTYPKVVKEAALEKMFDTDLSFREIADQLSIPRATLHQWKRQYKMKEDTTKTTHSSAESWTPEEKFAVVLHTATMSEVELNAYCREKGLYPGQIKGWREACIRGNEPHDKYLRRDATYQQHKRKIKTLERELKRKDQALAETVALLVLRKKYDALWEDPEDD
jgi:transposase